MLKCKCDGFVPMGARACPHCARPVTSSVVRKWARGLATLAGGATLAVTLMACYGLPPCDDAVDEDEDGFFICVGGGVLRDADCDDTDAEINPDAEDEEGDGVDQNCDGVDGIFEPDAPGDDAGPGGDAGPLEEAPAEI